MSARFDFSIITFLIVERSSGGEVNDDIADVTKLFIFRFRFRTEKIAWEIVGVRPLESTSNLLFLPYLKATFHF